MKITKEIFTEGYFTVENTTYPMFGLRDRSLHAKTVGVTNMPINRYWPVYQII